MPTLQLIITDAGRQAIVDEGAAGLPVVLSQFALGTGAWSPDATAAALQAELKRIDTIGGLVVAEESIQVTCTDDSADAYALGEFGLYTDKGVLFAIYSDTGGISDKAADAILLLVADVLLTSVPPGSVTVKEVGFSNPVATESAPGVAAIATQEKTDDGVDDETIVSPKKLMGAASSTSVGNKLVRRDANGNFRTNAPQNDNDVPRKVDVDTVQNNLNTHAGQANPHGATSAATPSRLILRDPNGRAKVAAPAENDDIARKAEVDAAKNEAMFPTGFIMLAAQSTAPTGWTKLTDHNNKALRVVSGAAGSGGSVAFSTAFANRTVSSVVAGGSVGSYAITQTTMAAHAHRLGQTQGTNGAPYYAEEAAAGKTSLDRSTETVGGSGSHSHPFTGISHNHTLDMTVQYVDVIRIQKN